MYNFQKFILKITFTARKIVAVVKKTVKVVQFNKNYYFCIIFSAGEGAL